MTEIDVNGTRKIVLARHTVYYRHGAKSEPATPLQLQKIVEKRTLHVRDELIRRVREVPVQVIGHGNVVPSTSGTTMTVTRLTRDPSAPAIRLIRAPGQAGGVFLHEELSDGLFDEINNVLDANGLLAGNSKQFVFGDEIYYRIYAERHHVQPSSQHPELLLKTACRDIYAPFLFWLTILSPEVVAHELVRSVNNLKHPVVLSSFRAIVLLGEGPTVWLERMLEEKYRRLIQKPEFYWSFKKMIDRVANDRRLLAMRTTNTANLDIPGAGQVGVSELLESPENAAAQLSKLCFRVFKGEGAERTLARLLDVAAYGKQVEQRGTQIWQEIQKIAGVLHR